MRPATDFEMSVARMVLKAVELRENSYDQVAADEATDDYQVRDQEFRASNPDRLSYIMPPDYKKFYTIDLEVACERAAGPLGRLIFLALDGWWNDAITWAQMMTDPTGTVAPGLENCQHGTIWPKQLVAEEEVEPPSCEKCDAFWETVKCKD